MTSNKRQLALTFRVELCSDSLQKLLAQNINLTKRSQSYPRDRGPFSSADKLVVLKKKMLNMTKRTQAYSQVRGPLPQASMDYSPFAHSREFAVMWCTMAAYGEKIDSRQRHSGMTRLAGMTEGAETIKGLNIFSPCKNYRLFQFNLNRLGFLASHSTTIGLATNIEL